jgi:hypothetical protein
MPKKKKSLFDKAYDEAWEENKHEGWDNDGCLIADPKDMFRAGVKWAFKQVGGGLSSM